MAHKKSKKNAPSFQELFPCECCVLRVHIYANNHTSVCVLELHDDILSICMSSFCFDPTVPSFVEVEPTPQRVRLTGELQNKKVTRCCCRLSTLTSSTSYF